MYELFFWTRASSLLGLDYALKGRYLFIFLGSSQLLRAIKGGGKLLTLKQWYMCIWEARIIFKGAVHIFFRVCDLWEWYVLIGLCFGRKASTFYHLARNSFLLPSV